MLKRINQMVESVKQFLGGHIDEFHRGDIVVEIGYTLKYIVVDEYETVYFLKPMWYADGRFLDIGRLGQRDGNRIKLRVEDYAVKVGTWDFEQDKEVEDDPGQ